MLNDVGQYSFDISAGELIVDIQSKTFSFTPITNGSYELKFTVTDNDSDSIEQTSTINVLENNLRIEASEREVGIEKDISEMEFV